MLADTHCHLDHGKFDPDRAEVIQRAQQAGISHILIPGLDVPSSNAVARLAENCPIIFSAVGVHPTEAAGLSNAYVDALLALTKNPKVKAIGEIGLDYYWDACPPDQQQSVLKDQLALAAETHLPVVIHFREKGDLPDGPCAFDLLLILEGWVNSLRLADNPLVAAPGVLHSFSGSISSAQKAMELGFFLGVTGPVTYNKTRQELITSLPLNKVQLETDSPFLAPAPLRGRRNEPANVRLIADKIAMLHACKPEDVARVTSANANQLFHWDD